jgi:hypothetical protein
MRKNALMSRPGAWGVILATGLSLGAGTVAAQTSPEPLPQQQPRAPGPDISLTQPQTPMAPLQRAAQELRVAHQQLGDSQNAASQQAITRVRVALDQVERAMGDVPEDRRAGLQQQVAEARQAVQGDDVRAPQARSAIQRVLDAIPTRRSDAPAGPATDRRPLSRYANLVGTTVIGADGAGSGQVENLLIDGNGQVRAAVVEWGGFLGIGTRRAVVPLERLRFSAADDRARMDLTREELEALPRYEANRLAEHARDGGWPDGVRTYR